jgi:hypothetical protein
MPRRPRGSRRALTRLKKTITKKRGPCKVQRTSTEKKKLSEDEGTGGNEDMVYLDEEKAKEWEAHYRRVHEIALRWAAGEGLSENR